MDYVKNIYYLPFKQNTPRTAHPLNRRPFKSNTSGVCRKESKQYSCNTGKKRSTYTAGAIILVFLFILLQPNFLFAKMQSPDVGSGSPNSNSVVVASGIENSSTSQKWKSLNKELEGLIGNRDAIIVAAPDDRVIFSENADKKLVPASTLKILTALVALNILGPNYRFATEFYLDKDSNLTIKGYGDPLLVSETVNKISRSLSPMLKSIKDIVLDATYFKDPLVIPGISDSSEPYDAPNGALCVNFNTVYFKQNKNNAYVSAEPQTPLLPFSLNRIRKSGLQQGRIVLSHNHSENIRYAGHLFQYFFNKAGIPSSGKIRTGRVNKDTDRLIFKYASEFTLMQAVSKLFEYSNNFMSNQVLIAAGAKVYGPPGSIEKGVLAAKAYIKQALEVEDIQIVEGSGISRANKVSAKTLYAVLQQFEPYYQLLTKSDSAYVKTGTLHGIRTRAGYIESAEGKLYRFVILINTPGKNVELIMDRLMKNID
jgi:D-alanyl-D-alanine carboxypeptidase/D-alanyl-D-alanine-endopeptidase (penicillin-binding protein 4)